jgi:amino acid transporter
MSESEGKAQTVQPLARGMKVLGVLFLTLSSATPASSIFVIVPDVIGQAGSGALIAMLAAGLIAVCVSQVYAELASAFPLAGGEYAMTGRVLGPWAGFAVLALNLANSLTGAAVLALGVGPYLAAAAPGPPPVAVAVAVVGGATLLGVLNIRTNAWVTGAFVAVELIALLVLTALGAAHPSRGLGELLVHPVALAGGHPAPAPVAAIGLAVAVAIFAYDGYGSAVYFSEEMQGAPRRIGRTITWALIIVLAAELIPLTAVLTGAPNLKALLASPAPFGDFTLRLAGPVVSRLMGAGVALAIVNAVIAMVLLTARQLYATGRDGIWPGPLSAAFVTLHPRFRSPWVATLIGGCAAAALCLVSLKVLLIITGTGVALIYGILCLAVIVGRRTGITAGAPYRGPLVPLLPALTAAALLGVLYADWLDPAEGRPGLIVALLTASAGALYYGLVVRRRGGFALRGPDDAVDVG